MGTFGIAQWFPSSGQHVLLGPADFHVIILSPNCTRKDILGNLAGACGYRMAMKQASRSGLGGPALVKITAGTEDDLPAIVGILNYTAANSIARFETRPVSVAERRDWFGQFSATGAYRLLVARGDDQVLGYACSQRYRDHEAFRETVEVSIALDAGSRGQGVGTALYRVLFDSLALEPSVHVALAWIWLPNDASVALHRKYGYKSGSTALAVDWTGMETFSRPPPAKGGPCADPEASWGHRKNNLLRREDELSPLTAALDGGGGLARLDTSRLPATWLRDCADMAPAAGSGRPQIPLPAPRSPDPIAPWQSPRTTSLTSAATGATGMRMRQVSMGRSPRGHWSRLEPYRVPAEFMAS